MQMETFHRIINANACNMQEIADSSVQLIVTSPPYPMISMWDDSFSKQNTSIGEALINNEANVAFSLMHNELEKVWKEISRVVCDGGFVCINIGDATRTFNENFALYSNHSKIIDFFVNNGFVNLPNVIWRKPTNAPNKFMGSGMLPAGAYITLEHEWILIFKKQGKRIFKTKDEKLNRKESAIFWEERNRWFSDIWDDIRGVNQKLTGNKTRLRSGAFPLEISYRLINMYSVIGDTVLDPFSGTGTTSIAALISNRNSLGYDIDKSFADMSIENVSTIPIDYANNIIRKRIENHNIFIKSYKNKPKYFCENLHTQVITSQETEIRFSYIKDIKKKENCIIAEYSSTAEDSVGFQPTLCL